jgi:hypothetical protein
MGSLEDVRLPPGGPSPPSLLKLVHLLRALKDVESPDMLAQCKALFFVSVVFDVRSSLTTGLNYSLFFLAPEEYYSIHTSPIAATFCDYVIKGYPASRGQGPLSESRFKEIWAVAASAEIKERPQQDVEEVVSKFKTFSCPWILAYQIPLDDRSLSQEEKMKNLVERTDCQRFFRPDRMDTLAY